MTRRFTNAHLARLHHIIVHSFTYASICFGILGLSLFSQTISAPVFAQTSAAIDEIVVTSRKIAESLQDVPIAVTAFTANDIEDAGITRPEDFVSLTPNVVMVNTANAGDTQVTIRGITSTRDAESNFALVVDGVLVTNPNGFNRELLDIEQIEVLKGPQGALYGRNASSGAILITTKKPTGERAVRLSADTGNNNSYKWQGTVQGAIADNVSARFSFSTSSTDGFETNLLTQQDDAIDYFEDTSLRGRMLVESNNSNWDFRAGYSTVKGGAINFNATFALPVAAGILGPDYHVDVNAHEFQYFPNIKPENEQKTFDMSVKYETELNNGLMLTATLAYNDLDEWLLSDGTSGSFGVYHHMPQCRESLDRPEVTALVNGYPATFYFPPADPDEAPSAANTLLGPYTPSTCDGFQYQERNQQDTSLEVRLQGSTDRADWIIGGYLAQIEREVVVAYGGDLGEPIPKQAYVEGQTDLLFWDDFETDVYSIFGQYTFDMNERTELAFEGRYDREERSVSNNVPKAGRSHLATLGTVIRTTPINPARTNINDDIPNRSEDFSQFQPKISLRYDVSEQTNLYTSYGYGFRSGGFNSIGSEALIDNYFNSGGAAGGSAVNAGLDVKDQYEKEVSRAFEVGLKGRYLDGRLQFNAAAFRTEVEDNQFFEFFAGPFGLMRVVTTIDELELTGAELDIRFAATENLRLDAGFGITEGEIKENNHRPYTVGNEAPLTPEYTLNLGAQYTKQFGALEGLFRIDYAYIGETHFHTVQNNETRAIWCAFGPGAAAFCPTNFDKTSRDAYDTLDMRASLNGENWSLSLWGRNVLDEEYLMEIINAPEFGGSFIHEAPGASFGLNLEYRL